MQIVGGTRSAKNLKNRAAHRPIGLLPTRQRLCDEKKRDKQKREHRVFCVFATTAMAAAVATSRCGERRSLRLFIRRARARSLMRRWHIWRSHRLRARSLVNRRACRSLDLDDSARAREKQKCSPQARQKVRLRASILQRLVANFTNSEFYADVRFMLIAVGFARY